MLKFLTVTVCILAFLLSTVYFTFLEITKIENTSMEPTVKEKESVVFNKKAYLLVEPQKGEIVLFKNENKTYIARVVGLPDEKIKFQDGNVFINEQQQEESYLKKNGDTHAGLFENSVILDGEEQAIPAETFFLLTDNRGYTIDSRVLGPVAKEKIIGKFLFKY